MTDPALAGAMALHQAGRLDEAIRAYRALLPRRKADPQLNHLLGLALFAKGDAKAALEPIRAALARVPGHPQLLNDMGNVLRALGRQSEAAEAFRAACDQKVRAGCDARKDLAIEMRATVARQLDKDNLPTAVGLADDYREHLGADWWERDGKRLFDLSMRAGRTDLANTLVNAAPTASWNRDARRAVERAKAAR